MGRSEPSGFVLVVSPCLCCRPCARTRARFLSETTLVSGLAHRFSDRFLVRSLFHRQNEKAWQTSLSTACPASVVIVAHIGPGGPTNCAAIYSVEYRASKSVFQSLPGLLP